MNFFYLAFFASSLAEDPVVRILQVTFLMGSLGSLFCTEDMRRRGGGERERKGKDRERGAKEEIE